VRFAAFRNSGVGALGKQLGPGASLTFFTQAVELAFDVDANARQKYRNLRPTQWSGTEAVWIKQGVPPIGDAKTSPWRLHKSGPGSGLDDPLPENCKDTGTQIIYFDSPGTNLLPFSVMTPRVSRLYVVQNFTGWIIGQRIGGADERMCPVAGWFAITDLACVNWFVEDKAAASQWARMPQSNQSGEGWADTSHPPAV
jgi:hypothetical protein